MTVNPGELFSNHYAFLVGIDVYDNPNFADLEGAHADAAAIHEALLAVGYPAENLRLVPPERTSLDALLHELGKFKKLAEESVKRTPPLRPDILIFWAGHGVPAGETSYLITRDSLYGDVKSAIPLGDITDTFKKYFPVSLTVFFDVCHSIPRDRSDLRQDMKNLILAPMRDQVRRDSQRWAFVGVSTYAYEHPAAQRGILATVLEKALLGEPCDDQDGERCSDSDCVVSVERILSKLQQPVERRARQLGASERVAVLRDRDGLDHPKAIGLAVKRHEELRLDEERLPLQALLLARAILSIEHGKVKNITQFGQELADLVRDLIHGLLQREDFLRRERALVRSAILNLRRDPSLNAYMGFLLYCRQEAVRHTAAKDVLVRLYEHLVSGGSPGFFEEYLRAQDQIIAKRVALPWSCGIRVLRGKDQYGYAPILTAGSGVTPSSKDASKTFVTTSTLQQEALVQIYRGDAAISSIPDSSLQYCGYLTSARFAHELAIDTRVWVKMGPDDIGCGEGCEAPATSIYAPMKILLGREGTQEHDWKGHWHLDLGGSDDEIGGGLGPGSESSWVTGMKLLLDECFRFLMTLEDGDEEELENIVVNWLCDAERLLRARNDSKLRHVLETLISGLRRNPASSVMRLATALLTDMESLTSIAQQAITNEKWAAVTYKKVSRDVLEYYERWQADHTQEREQPVAELRSHEILARLLEAVITPPGKPLRDATDKVVELVAYAAVLLDGHVRLWASLATRTQAVVKIMDYGASDFARTSPSLLGLAVKKFLDTEGSELLSMQQARNLLRWIESERKASGEDSIENSLHQLLELFRTEIRLGTLLLAQGFLDAIGVAPRNLPIFRDLMSRLRHDVDTSDTREAAEQMYQLLRQLYLDRLRNGELPQADASVFLLALTALLWPEHEGLVVRLSTTAAFDWPTAMEISHEALDQRNLAGVVDAGLPMDQLLKNAAMVDRVRQGLNRIRKMAIDRMLPVRNLPPKAEPRRSDGWHDPMLLGIPLEES